MRRFAASAATALWGLALAVSLAPTIQRPASLEALPSAMAAAGLDAASAVRQMAVIIILTAVCAVGGARFFRDAPRWSFVLSTLALATSPLTLIAGGATRHVVMHAAIAIGANACRKFEPRFSRRDVILIPAGIVIYFALLDLAPSTRPVTLFIAAVAMILAVRLATGNLAERIPGQLIATVIYPLFITAYPLALLGIGSAPHLDFYEDGIELVPASEMLRGERPYADIVPVHSLLADGGIAYLVMKSGHDTAGDVLRVRRAISALNLTAIYCVALAATASAEAGLLAALLTVVLFPASSIWLRTIPALFALAAAVAGVRTRRWRWFGVAGALIAASFLVGMEFAVYSAVAAVVAAIRMPERRRALLSLIIGIVAATIPILLIFAILGFAGPFVRVTIGEILPSGNLYVPGPLQAPDFLQSFSKLASSLTRPEALVVLLWFLAVIVSLAMLARRRSRADGIWIIGVWIAVAAISFAQRRHVYYAFAIAPFVIGSLMHLRRQTRSAFVTLAILTGVIAMPLVHIFEVATPLRRSGGVTAGNNVPLTATPRARGAVAPREINDAIATAGEFVRSQLAPQETWMDFANAPGLYYFLDRDCPTRHHHVVFYETVAGQQEVIAALERNRAVRAVLMSFPGGVTAIDGVSNRDRAPLVARYIDEHFHPAFDRNGVVFWTR